MPVSRCCSGVTSAGAAGLEEARLALMVLALEEWVVLDRTDGEPGLCLWRRLRGEACSAEKERWGMTMFAGRSLRRLRAEDDVFGGETGLSSGVCVSDGGGELKLLIWNTFSFSGVSSLSQLMICLKKPSTPMDSRFGALPRGRVYFE